MRTAFPWVPETSWQSRNVSGVDLYRVEVEDPRGDAAPIMKRIRSGWHERPGEAWTELARIADVWIGAAGGVE